MQTMKTLFTIVLACSAALCFSQPAAVKQRSVALLDCTARNNETSDGEIYSARHFLKLAGIPFVVTTNVDTAMQYGMIIASSRLQSSTMNQPERDSLAAFVSRGGTLVAPIVTDNALFNLFGVSAVASATTRYTMTFDTAAAPAECRWLNDTAEVKISLGRASYVNVITTRNYTIASGQSLGKYDDLTDAIVRNTSGQGTTYALGFSFKSLCQTNQLNLDYEAQRVYSNGFEPTSDAVMFFLKGIYTLKTPRAVWLHTSPGTSTTSLLITHDVDATTAYDTMSHYADYEFNIGVKSTYLITTHYINDDWLSDFYNASSIPKVQYVLGKGHFLASHSVGHFPDFDSPTIFPLGNQNNTQGNYLPYYPTNGPTAGGSVYGELQVSKQILENDYGVTIRTFRSGHLAYNPKMINALDTLGYTYNTTNAAADVLTHFPFRGRFDKNSNGMLSNTIWEIPMTISDVFQSNPIDNTNYPQKVAIWLDVINRNRANNAANILLIHPNRMYKLTAEMSLISQLPGGVFLSDIETFGDYWRQRDGVTFTSRLDGDTLTVIVPSALLPLDSMISFIADHGQLLDLVKAEDENGNPLTVMQSNWDDDDLVLHFAPQLIITGTPPPEDELNLVVYPNPLFIGAGNDRIALEFDAPAGNKVYAAVLDLSGRIIQTEQFVCSGEKRQYYELAAGNLAAGMYLIRIETTKGAATKRLLIAR